MKLFFNHFVGKERIQMAKVNIRERERERELGFLYNRHEFPDFFSRLPQMNCIQEKLVQHTILTLET